MGRVRYRFTTAVTDATKVGKRLSIPNFGLNTRAKTQDVLDDRQALSEAIERPIVWMKQTHSDVVRIVGLSDSQLQDSVAADAIVTSNNVALAVQVADCVPVILFDEHARITAAVHAGREGAKNYIVAKTVATMLALGSMPSNITAVVGPHICANCYEVGKDVFEQTVAVRPEMAGESRYGTPSLDLKAAVRSDLRDVGSVVFEDRCTYESLDLNSYRRNPGCGRQVGLVYIDS